MVICGLGVFTAMALINWAATTSGTAAAFGIYVSGLYSTKHPQFTNEMAQLGSSIFSRSDDNY